MYKKMIILLCITGFIFGQEVESSKEKKYNIETLEQLTTIDLQEIPIRNIDISSYVLVDAVQKIFDAKVYRTKGLKSFFKYIKRENRPKYNAFKNYVIGRMLSHKNSDCEYQKKLVILANDKIGQELYKLVYGTGIYNYLFTSEKDLLKEYLKTGVIFCMIIKYFLF